MQARMAAPEHPALLTPLWAVGLSTKCRWPKGKGEVFSLRLGAAQWSPPGIVSIMSNDETTAGGEGRAQVLATVCKHSCFLREISPTSCRRRLQASPKASVLDKDIKSMAF